jgi:hypothetical protein
MRQTRTTWLLTDDSNHPLRRLLEEVGILVWVAQLSLVLSDHVRGSRPSKVRYRMNNMVRWMEERRG